MDRASIETYRQQSGEKTAEECETLLRAGFSRPGPNGTPEPVAMSLGQLDEPHHPSCYRLYNLYREIGAHRYASRATVQYQSISPGWEAVRAEAVRVSREAAEESLVPSTPSDGDAGVESPRSTPHP